MKYIFLVLFCLTTIFGFSQDKRPVSDSVLVDGTKHKLFKDGKSFFAILNNGDSLFYLLDEKDFPKFPGGKKAMFEYLGKNINYPQEAKNNKIYGKVYVNFIINKTGSLEKTNIIKGVHHSLNNEALRVVNSFPKWIPGVYKGKNVSVITNLPINFVLPGRETPSGVPTRALTLFKKGQKFFKKNDFKKAIYNYSEAIKWHRSYKEAYTKRAICYSKISETEKACKDW